MFNIFLNVLEKLLTIFLIILPEELALFLGARLGDSILFLSRFTHQNKYMSDRKYMTNNVRLTFGNRFNKKERYAIVQNGLRKMGKSLVEVFRFPILNKTNLHKKVQFIGKEYLDQAFARNRGVILISAHFGNWELLGAGLSLEGYSVSTVIQPQINPVVDNFLNRRRKSKGMKVILRWYTDLRVLVKLLKENYVLGMLVDQHSESEKIFGTFFGHRVSLHEGPAMLSVLTGSPIIPAFIICNTDDTHCIIIEPSLDVESVKEKSRDEKIAIISQMISSALEKYISLYPDHWNWMYNRWDKLK